MASPEQLGRLEQRWWRAHHQKDKTLLSECLRRFFAALYDMESDDAAAAVDAFLGAVSGHDRKTWNGVSALATFYERVSHSIGRSFDIRRAAALEELWWKQHDASSDVLHDDDLRGTIAALYQTVFGIPEERALLIATLRARAIHAHDQAEALPPERSAESEHFWTEVERQLTSSYEVLRAERQRE